MPKTLKSYYEENHTQYTAKIKHQELNKKRLRSHTKNKKSFYECGWINCKVQSTKLSDIIHHQYRYHIYNKYVFKDPIEDELKQIVPNDDEDDDDMGTQYKN